MHVSRSARITLLLVIDVVFFFVELIAGYAVGSLALVADSFHMLNDVMSLIVALYAIKLTEKNEADSRYTYGWHRAEILAALVNGVFLLALCFSIFMEAIERFFSTPEISNPKLVVIVGSFGLASNIVGLFLFHEHGHDHSHGHDRPHAKSRKSRRSSVPHLNGTDNDASSSAGSNSGTATPTDGNRTRKDSVSSLYGHPAATRAAILETAEDIQKRTASPLRSDPTDTPRSPTMRSPLSRLTSLAIRDGNEANRPEALSTETTPLLRANSEQHTNASSHSPATFSSHAHHGEDSDNSETDHRHGSGHGHSHAGSMNMRALVLHVLGDALGNVGVIATGLIIWLSSWSFKYYFDPIISLVITVIIFSSALPLVRSASFILLQGVPSTISLESVREAILAVDGVLSVHELHIWQLSETKVIASVHVMASLKKQHQDFMPVAAQIRNILHQHGIHSCTIQPEYHPRDPSQEDAIAGEAVCLVPGPAEHAENTCCPPPPAAV